jgi:hypothetical protein
VLTETATYKCTGRDVDIQHRGLFALLLQRSLTTPAHRCAMTGVHQSARPVSQQLRLCRQRSQFVDFGAQTMTKRAFRTKLFEQFFRSIEGSIIMLTLVDDLPETLFDGGLG